MSCLRRFLHALIAPVMLAISLLALPVSAFAETPEPASAVASAPHTAIPFKQEKQSTGGLAYQSFAALVLVGLAAYGIVFSLKRFGGKVSGKLGLKRRVQTLEITRLSRRSMLYVVEYNGQELLLAENDHGIQLLTASAVPSVQSAAIDTQGEHNA